MLDVFAQPGLDRRHIGRLRKQLITTHFYEGEEKSIQGGGQGWMVGLNKHRI